MPLLYLYISDFAWASEVIETPQRADAEKCSSSMLASGNVTCGYQVVVEYETNRREFTALPVYSKWVCARYETQCGMYALTYADVCRRMLTYADVF